MPYERRGLEIWTDKTGTWKLRDKCKTVDDAKKQLRLLNAVEHGWVPTHKK